MEEVDAPCVLQALKISTGGRDLQISVHGPNRLGPLRVIAVPEWDKIQVFTRQKGGIYRKANAVAQFEQGPCSRHSHHQCFEVSKDLVLFHKHAVAEIQPDSSARVSPGKAPHSGQSISPSNAAESSIGLLLHCSHQYNACMTAVVEYDHQHLLDHIWPYPPEVVSYVISTAGCEPGICLWGKIEVYPDIRWQADLAIKYSKDHPAEAAKGVAEGIDIQGSLTCTIGGSIGRDQFETVLGKEEIERIQPAIVSTMYAAHRLVDLLSTVVSRAAGRKAEISFKDPQLKIAGKWGYTEIEERNSVSYDLDLHLKADPLMAVSFKVDVTDFILEAIVAVIQPEFLPLVGLVSQIKESLFNVTKNAQRIWLFVDGKVEGEMHFARRLNDGPAERIADEECGTVRGQISFGLEPQASFNFDVIVLKLCGDADLKLYSGIDVLLSGYLDSQGRPYWNGRIKSLGLKLYGISHLHADLRIASAMATTMTALQRHLEPALSKVLGNPHVEQARELASHMALELASSYSDFVKHLNPKKFIKPIVEKLKQLLHQDRPAELPPKTSNTPSHLEEDSPARETIGEILQIASEPTGEIEEALYSGAHFIILDGGERGRAWCEQGRPRFSSSHYLPFYLGLEEKTSGHHKEKLDLTGKVFVELVQPEVFRFAKQNYLLAAPNGHGGPSAHEPPHLATGGDAELSANTQLSPDPPPEDPIHRLEMEIPLKKGALLVGYARMPRMRMMKYGWFGKLPKDLLAAGGDPFSFTWGQMEQHSCGITAFKQGHSTVEDLEQGAMHAMDFLKGVVARLQGKQGCNYGPFGTSDRTDQNPIVLIPVKPG